MSDLHAHDLDARLDAALGWDAATDAGDDLNLATAAIDLAFTLRDAVPMSAPPPALRERLELDAARWRAQLPTAPRTTPSAPNASAPLHVPRATWNRWPWLVAAASVVVTISVWFATRPEVVPAPEVARTALLSEPDTVQIDWTDPSGQGVSGDVVWNQRMQQGYLRIAGLPANDPKQMQYQLWIFDDARAAYSDITAVDGGVFDIVCTDAIVPIDPKLDVSSPSLFAVTTEPPGGVIRHNPDRDPRYHIVLTAPAQG